RRRHTRFSRDWSSDVCSSDLLLIAPGAGLKQHPTANGAVDFPQLLKRLGTVGGMNVQHHVTDFFVGLQILGGDINVVVGKHPVEIGRASCRDRASSTVGMGAQ